MKLPDNIHSRLRITHIGLAVIPLIIVGLVLTWTTYKSQQNQVVDLQEELAHRMGTFTEDYLHSLETNLRVTAKISNLTSLTKEEQEDVFSLLQSAQNLYVNISIIN